MSLIQRAVQESGSVLIARPGLKPRREAAGTAEPGIGRTFQLDFRGLAGEGLITPGTLDSKLAGEFNAIKRRLLRRITFFPGTQAADAEDAGTTVIVTSALAGEGKTFTAANLAFSLALEDRIGVILIDADFPRSHLCELLGLGGQPGITDLLLDSRLQIGDVLQQAADLPICVLPTGSRRMSVAQIFADDRLALLFHDVARLFPNHLLVIDSPPLLATTEASALAPHADQIILVVEAGRSTREGIAEALELLGAEDRISLVLNRSFGRGTLGHRYYYGYRAADQAGADETVERG
jgi:Mrp family chromosome partitioning ATPase